MAHSSRHQARGSSQGARLARAQRALIVISIMIVGLCSSTGPTTSSHLTQPASTQALHLNKSANTNTNTTATAPPNQRHHQQQQQQGMKPTNRTAAEPADSAQANDNDYGETEDLAAALDENDPRLAELDKLFSLSLERVLKMITETDEDGDQQVRGRFRRQLNELELIRELNDTTPAPVYREPEQAARETTPRGEEPPALQATSSAPRQRAARAKKQAPSTTPQPSYSSPSVTGENPVGAYAMATTPASSVDAPQNVEVQVTNDGAPNEGGVTNDLADTLAISTTRPPSRMEKPASRKQASGTGELHHFKLSKVPGPEHNPMKDIRAIGTSNLNDDSSSGPDESLSQDQAGVNSLAEAIGAELANRQPEHDDATLLEQLTKPNFSATHLPLKRDKRPVQSRDEFQQPSDYQQSYQNNQRQSSFPTTAESMALTGAPPLAPYTFDQNMALLNAGNLRQPMGGERVMSSYSSPMANQDYSLHPTTANASRAASLARLQAENNWSVPLVSGGKSNKNSRTRASGQALEMTNDIGAFAASNNNNNDDLSMLFHNGKMQNKRAGLALTAENLKNNLLLPYQQPFSTRFSLSGSNKKQQQPPLAMGSNAAASVPYRHYLNPLASGNDQIRSSQEAIYGDGLGGQFAPTLMTHQGTSGASQNSVLGMLRVAPNQLNAAITGALQQQQQQQQQQRAALAPLGRRNSPLALLSGGGLSSAGTTDFLPYSSPGAYLAAAARYSRQQQQQNPQHRTVSAYQHRIGRHEPGANGAGANYDDGGGGGGNVGAGQSAASVATTSTSDPMWSDTQNHEEDYQQSPQTIQITAVPNGLGLANPGFVNGFNGFNGLGGWGGWGGPWNGRQVLLVNKQPQQVGTEWRSWLIPVAIILALPLILGALFIPVFLKSVMFLIQILQMLGLLMPPSQLASHLLSNTHGSQSG